MTSTDQSTPLSQPSKSCAIVQRISDSNLSVIFRLILDDSESAQEVYVFMMHSCLLSSMITVEKKVHLNLKNISLQHGFSDDDMETRLPVELNIQMGENYRTASNRTEKTHKILLERLGENRSCTKGLIFRFGTHALKYRQAHRHTHTHSPTHKLTYIHSRTHTSIHRAHITHHS